MKIATREQVENLKQNWLGDPCWDLERTDEIFDPFYDELLQFRLDAEERWKLSYTKKLKDKATDFGYFGNEKVGQLITNLEVTLQEASNKSKELLIFHLSRVMEIDNENRFEFEAIIDNLIEASTANTILKLINKNGEFRKYLK